MNYTLGGIQQACNEYTDQQYYLSQERDAAYAEGRRDEAKARQWQPIETVPEHCAVLIFTRSRGIKIERAEHVRRLIEDAKLHCEECNYTHWMHLPDDPEAGSGALGDGGSGV